jgi:hypothetical protein
VLVFPTFTARLRSSFPLRFVRVVVVLVTPGELLSLCLPTVDRTIKSNAPAALCPGKDGVLFALEIGLLSTSGNPVLGSNRIFDTFRFSRALINRGWFSRFVYVA